MEKFKNTNTNQISIEDIPSYEELASFLGSDLNRLVQTNSNDFNNSCNNPCDNLEDIYRLRIKLFGDNNSCDIDSVNSLILDNVGVNYSYIDGTASFGNHRINPHFNQSGMFTEIYSNNDNTTFKLTLSSNNDNGCGTQNNIRFTNDEASFRLSQIINNIGNFDELSSSNTGSGANICINQRSYVLNRCGKHYIVCNFNLTNNGDAIAQKILFKDVFPENILISDKSIFLDGCKVNSRDTHLNRNVAIVKLPNLEAGQSLDLMIVGLLSSFIRMNNFATISYISSCHRDRNRTVIDISQKLSNVKSI